MIDKIMNTMSSFMDRVSSWLSLPAVPWAEFRSYWMELVDMIAPWNRIFPITDIMTIVGLMVAFCVALMIFYTVVLIKSFIPMSGGK